MRLLQSLNRIGDRENRKSRLARSRRSQLIVSCESLETRALLSALSITGVNLVVTLNVNSSDDLEVTVNGAEQVYPPTKYTGIEITATGADNGVEINATLPNVPVSIDLSAGGGTVNVGNELSRIQGSVSVVGSRAALVINDQDTQSEETYSITSSMLSSSESAPITYSGVDFLNFTGGNASYTFGTPSVDTYNIESTEFGVPMWIIGGSCNNVFNVSPVANDLANVAGGLTVWGHVPGVDANGSDTLNIDDQNGGQSSFNAATYDITSSTVTASDAAPISYATMSNVNISGSSNADTYNIESTPSGTAMQVTGTSGRDTFEVSPTARSLATIQGNLTIGDLALGGNTLNIDDQNNSAADTYTLASASQTSSTVTRTGAATISYASEEAVNLYGGGNDTYNVNGTPSGTAVTVEGESGKDTFNVSPTAKSLATIQGNLTVDDSAGDGSNTLNIDDQNNSASDTYTLASASMASSSVTRTGAATISYASDKAVHLYGGGGNDTYNVNGTPSGSAVTVQGESGKDTFNVSPTAKSLATIQGNLTVDDSAGDGSNTLNIDDQNNSASDPYSLAYFPSVGTSQVTRTAAATISYASEGAVNVYGGSGNDTYNVGSTAPGSTVAITGGSGTNTLVGPSTANNWAITARNGGTLDSVVPFSKMANLTGGTGTDTFVMEPGGTVTGKINGGGGINTLEYFFNTPVTVNLQTDRATGIGGFANIQSFVGSATIADTLVGANTSNTWSITAINEGTVNSITFNGFANLTGGTALDTFVFKAEGSVTGKINGSGGGNWLDYAAYATPVTVNLKTGTATNVGGGIANIQNVRGGQGTDILAGDSQGNILIGGAGTNTITGGSGESILIGDKGKDSVMGGSGGDILIAGYTSYDSSTLANDMALESILTEWQSGNPYGTRISKIKSGVGPGSADKLVWGTTVFDNAQSEANTLTPASGTNGAANWFFANTAHTTINNKTGSEELN